MKRFILAFVSTALLTSTALAAPKKKAAVAAPQAAGALAAVGLDAANIKATVQAPAGAKAVEQFGAALVTSGDKFQLEISEGATDIAGRKKEIAENDINKLKKYHVETADALLYETEVMGQNEFHFVANVKLGDAAYKCEDVKGPAFKKADVEAMLKSCQSLAAK